MFACRRILLVCLLVSIACLASGQEIPTVYPRRIAPYSFGGQIHSIAFRPNSTDLAVGLFSVRDGGKAILCKSWPARAVKDTTLDSMPSPCFCVTFDPSGARIAWCSWTPGKQIRIAGYTGGPRSIDCGKVNVTWVAFDPAAPTNLASNSTDGFVRIWDINTRRLLAKLPAGGARGLCVAYSPDGRMLAGSYRNGRVQIWRSDSPDAEPLILDAHSGPVNSLAFSPNSRLIATASADKTVSLWESATGRRIRSLGGAHLDPVTCLTFTPDGKYLATGDKAGKVVFWNMSGFRPVTAFFPHKEPVYGLAMSSDGEHLATGSQDGTINFFSTRDLGFRMGRVRVLARFEKVRIMVDGMSVSEESTDVALPPGRHEIVATTEDGSSSKLYPVEVAADTEQTVSVDIRSALGKLFVTSSEPSDITISSGDQSTRRIANSTIDRMTPGRYTVTITPRDRKYVTQILAVDIKPAETAHLIVIPRLAPGDPSPPTDRATIRQVRINPRDGAEMVWIPGGVFTMGRRTSDRDARPAHSVSLGGFWIYRYPVTVAQYRKFCEATAGTENEHPMPPEPKWGWVDDHPIVSVSWQDARDYSRWAFGDDRRVYLPRELQYERAMQGPMELEYPWGSDFYTDECINSIKPNHPTGTAPVGTRAANGWGLYDIAGNVWEWCADWYDAEFYRKPDGAEPAPGRMRVIRGGAWDTRNSKMFRTDYRGKSDPAARTPNTGFRCAAG